MCGVSSFGDCAGEGSAGDSCGESVPGVGCDGDGHTGDAAIAVAGPESCSVELDYLA